MQTTLTKTSFERMGAMLPKNWDLAHWLESGSIARQFKILFRASAVLVVLLGIAAAMGFVRVEDRSTKLADLTDIAFLTASIANKINLSKDEMGAYRARGYLQSDIDRAIELAQDAVAQNAQLRKAAGSVDPAYLPLIDKLDQDLEGVVTLVGEVKNAPLDLVVQESFLGPKYDHITATVGSVDALREDAAGRVEEVSTDGLGELQALIVAMILIAALALGLVLFGQRFVNRRIVGPIGNISDVSLRVSDGETNLVIPETEREDEIGIMARSLTVIQEKSDTLIEMQGKATTAAEAELEYQKSLQDERGKHTVLLIELADKFERTVGNVTNEVSSATNQLQSAATAMSDNAGKSSQEAVIAADRLNEASSAVVSAASASDEFMLSIGEISRQAANSANRARVANEAAVKANETIAALDATATQVSGIVELISHIAQRTNMLALNATIEAARSGEAGRGFAVVASEVKELATQTSKATEDVEQQIKAIQNSTAAGVLALRDIVSEITDLENTAISIASAVDQQSVAGQDIAKSIDRAARSAEAVNENVSLVSNMSVETGSAASQVLVSCGHLETQADQLRTHVDEFLRQVRAG